MTSIEALSYLAAAHQAELAEAYRQANGPTFFQRLEQRITDWIKGGDNICDHERRATIAALAVLSSLPIIVGLGLDNADVSVPSSAASNDIPAEFAPGLQRELRSIETHGSLQPLNLAEFDQLVETLNSQESEMSQDTCYGTIVVTETAYRQFPHDNGESFEQFISRQEAGINQMFADLDPSIVQLLDQANLPRPHGLNIRRIIVVEDETARHLAPNRLTIQRDIHDSDGIYIMPGEYEDQTDGALDGIYRPRDSRNYIGGIDWTLAHEWGHVFFHLPDQYPLEFPNPDTRTLLGIPETMRQYLPDQTRADIANSIMNHQADYHNHRLGIVEILQLATRQAEGRAHSPLNLYEAGRLYPNHIPQEASLEVNRELAGGLAFIYRATEIGPYTDGQRRQQLDPVATLIPISDTGTFQLPDNIFPARRRTVEGLPPDVPVSDEMVLAEDGVIVIVAINDAGETFVRWLDIRDFLIAKWLGYDNQVIMSLNMARTSEPYPQGFDWAVEYRAPETTVASIP